MRDVHHPLPRMSRQVDLVVRCHMCKVALDVRLFHEAEAQLHADDAATLLVAVEYNAATTVIVNVRNLRVDYLNENEVTRKDAIAVPQQTDERGRPIRRMTHLRRRQH